ncbi:MAG TPA: acetolactate synthase large subunit [Allosphingosinicella sp.]|nr:acetolactate synthase large subunit [Allosphingosinicella sp.]
MKLTLPDAEPEAVGADVVLSALAGAGVDTLFANPGTSEMHLVAALDREPRIRPVLCLFEGVATGAADGYARMAGRPACVLLHLGPGYSNGAANLHNARRAYSPVVSLVGDHAVSHRHLDAPLASDIATLAAASSNWIRTAEEPNDVGLLVQEAVAASMGPPAGPATLILPADCTWAPAPPPPPQRAFASKPHLDAAQVEAAAASIRAARAPLLLLGGKALEEKGLRAAARLAGAGYRIATETFPARQARGTNIIAPDRMKYFGELALADLAPHDLLVLAGAAEPVAFFAYPNAPGSLVPPGCRVLPLVPAGRDSSDALAFLADVLGCGEPPAGGPKLALAEPTGQLTPQSIGISVARHLPSGAIVSDDAVTGSQPVFSATASAARHDWLSLTGGAIGQGIPVGIGAAIAQPGAKVVVLTGDGAGMYTPQSLWTIARENLDVIVVIFANRSYRILDIEYRRTGAGRPGPAAAALLDIGNPALDWVALAKGHGVSAATCSDASSFDALFARAMAQPGPMLIEAVIA